MDQAIGRPALYGNLIWVHGRAIALLVKEVRLRRAAEKKAALLSRQLQEVEVLEASAAFNQDGE